MVNDAGEAVVSLGATVDSEGRVTTYAPNGKEWVILGASSGDTG